MPALSIIEHLNVLEDVPCRVFTSRVVPMVYEFALERSKDAFDTGEVPASAGAAHAGADAVLTEQTLVARGSILTVAIRVVQKPCLRFRGLTVVRYKSTIYEGLPECPAQKGGDEWQG